MQTRNERGHAHTKMRVRQGWRAAKSAAKSAAILSLPRHIKPTKLQAANHAGGAMIFADPSGQRWRWCIRAVLVVLVCAVALIAVSWGPTHQPPTVSDGAAPLPGVAFPTDQPGRTPVIGTGPLVRLVKITRVDGSAQAWDVLTGQSYGPITGHDAQVVGSASYALQRYGYGSGVTKSIELTFDDGPDPTWTPQILAVLKQYHISATFFVIGSEAIKLPQLVQQEAADGFTIGNHSLTHPALTPDQVSDQFGETDHILRGVVGIGTRLIRLPYDGDMSPSSQAALDQVMFDAERLHYVVSLDEFDTQDWKYGDLALRPQSAIPLPPLTANNLTILLHDGGGDRAATVAYLERLIPWALAHGYHFDSLAEASPQVRADTQAVVPTFWDHEVVWASTVWWDWSDALLKVLFFLAIFSLGVVGIGNVLLALAQRYTRRRARSRDLSAGALVASGPPVSIVLAAYNEERVIARTIGALAQSRYASIAEIIVVDDGSRDGTAAIVTGLAARDPRIRLIRQANAGKAAALNRAFAEARSEIVVTLDADTVFAPTTVEHLVRQFVADRSGQLGAVAGIVKVGNVRSLLTRWQALEYILLCGIDRSAQTLLGAILVVPGACSAWRRGAVLKAGGYSRATLAEDCDLTIQLQRLGYRVSQDEEAACYTEVPDSVKMLLRQRFRWTYGTIQALWKHRDMLGRRRYGWLGLWILPYSAFSFLVPVVVLPFADLMAVAAVILRGGAVLPAFIVCFVVIQSVQFVVAVVGIWLLDEDWGHLWMVPLYRILYAPLRIYQLYLSVYAALRGVRPGWNKVARTGTVSTRKIYRLTPVPMIAAVAREMTGATGMTGEVAVFRTQP